jgi:hypothetical protein
MTVVEEVSFPDAVAVLVRDLTAEARRLVSADTVYKIGSSEVRAAVRSTGVGKKSKGVYLRIGPTPVEPLSFVVTCRSMARRSRTSLHHL